MKGYGQLCPIAKAAEILFERWTVLVLRDMLFLRSSHFNELRRGIPQISPSLLSKRLQTLQEHGLIVREASAAGQGWEYRITAAAEELKPLIMFVGHWGKRWVGGTLVRSELDPGMLMWFIYRKFPRAHLPADRVVIYLEFTDSRRMKRWWLVLEHGDVDLCLKDPGHDVDISFVTDLISLAQLYMGEMTFTEAVRSRKIRLEGPATLIRMMPIWFARSVFADTKSAAAAVNAKDGVLPPRPRILDELAHLAIREVQGTAGSSKGRAQLQMASVGRPSQAD